MKIESPVALMETLEVRRLFSHIPQVSGTYTGEAVIDLYPTGKPTITVALTLTITQESKSGDIWGIFTVKQKGQHSVVGAFSASYNHIEPGNYNFLSNLYVDNPIVTNVIPGTVNNVLGGLSDTKNVLSIEFSDGGPYENPGDGTLSQ